MIFEKNVFRFNIIKAESNLPDTYLKCLDIKAIFKIHSFLTLDSRARLHHRYAWGNGYSASSGFADAKGTKCQSTLAEDSCLLTKS